MLTSDRPLSLNSSKGTDSDIGTHPDKRESLTVPRIHEAEEEDERTCGNVNHPLLTFKKSRGEEERMTELVDK
jgi:hypothetical protein